MPHLGHLAKASRGIPVELSLPLDGVKPREEVGLPVDDADTVGWYWKYTRSIFYMGHRDLKTRFVP